MYHMQLYITLGNGHYYWDTSSPIRRQTFLLRSETLSGPEKTRVQFCTFMKCHVRDSSFLHFYTIGIFVVDLSRHVLGGAMSAYYNSSCIVQHWKTTTPETILKTYKVGHFEKLNSYKN